MNTKAHILGNTKIKSIQPVFTISNDDRIVYTRILRVLKMRLPRQFGGEDHEKPLISRSAHVISPEKHFPAFSSINTPY